MPTVSCFKKGLSDSQQDSPVRGWVGGGPLCSMIWGVPQSSCCHWMVSSRGLTQCPGFSLYVQAHSVEVCLCKSDCADAWEVTERCGGLFLSHYFSLNEMNHINNKLPVYGDLHLKNFLYTDYFSHYYIPTSYHTNLPVTQERQ